MQHAVYFFGWTAIKIYLASSVRSSIPSILLILVSKSRWFSFGWFTEKTRLTIMIRFVSNMIIFFLRVTKTVSMLHAWNSTFTTPVCIWINYRSRTDTINNIWSHTSMWVQFNAVSRRSFGIESTSIFLLIFVGSRYRLESLVIPPFGQALEITLALLSPCVCYI